MKHIYLFIFLSFIAGNIFAQADESIRTFSGHTESLNSVTFSPDGKAALSGSYDKTMKLWDVQSGEEIRAFRGHTNHVQAVAFSPEGKYALSGSDENSLKLWDVETGKEINSFSGHNSKAFVTSVAISPNGKYALSGSYDNSMTLWDAQTGNYIRSFFHDNIVYAVAFSPDGKYALSGSNDSRMKLWDVQTGKEVRTFSGHNGIIWSVAISSNGLYALSGSKDNTMKLWSFQTGKEIRTFTGHASTVFAVAFSPDGTFALSGSSDKTMKLWDTQTGKLIRTFLGHTNDIWSVAFNQDGKYALSGSKDNTMKLWDVSRSSSSLKNRIESYVNTQLQNWQKKGEFEKTADYLVRVSEENRKTNITKWQKEKIDELSKLEAKNYGINYFTLKEYDADNETYLLSGKDRNYVIKVPLASAPAFKQGFTVGTISNQEFILTDDGFKLSRFFISVYSAGSYSWSHATDNPYQQTAINYNFDKAEINLPTAQVNNKQNNIDVKQINVGKADVDVSIPSTNKKKPDAYVLAIGNEDYSSYQMSLDKEANVPFATNDADVFAKYCEKALGIPIANISVLKNATLGQMGQAISKLEKLAEIGKGNAELIFYYAGHGLPNEETKESYLIPVDVSGSNLTSGIRLNELYSRLGKFPTKKVTVFLDACFSGGSREGQLVALRSVRIKPKEETVANNMVVFTSSSGTESSAAYKEKGHGMFTYYLLKKLMESKGEATYKEMSDYLQQEVLKQSVLINSKEQTPQVKNGSMDSSVWGGWKF